MITLAHVNLARAGVVAHLCRGTVEALPYADASFDSVLNTMAFSGYPDGRKALVEMTRVLKPGGALILLDINFPKDGNRLGTWLALLWKSAGDLIRDVDALFREFGLHCGDSEVGGWGSVHPYVATKPREVG